MLSNRELFLLNTAQTSKTPRLTEVVSAEGVYLYGPSGERYIDLVSGFAVNNIGHRNARVVEAIKDQLASPDPAFLLMAEFKKGITSLGNSFPVPVSDLYVSS